VAHRPAIRVAMVFFMMMSPQSLFGAGARRCVSLDAEHAVGCRLVDGLYKRLQPAARA